METFLNALSELFKTPTAQEITIRVACIIGTGMGLRTVIRFYFYNFTKKSKSKIKDYSQHVVVPTQFIASIVTAWVYRWEIIPAGIITSYNGNTISSYKLAFLSIERMVAEGILYGLGSIAVYGGCMYLMKRYKIIK